MVGYTTSRCVNGKWVKARSGVLHVQPNRPLTADQRKLIPSEWCGFAVEIAAKAEGEVH
jgi:hypothetical protein